ncbi:ciliogenesis-associated TTC17-interacting protein-like [Sinocyclocheilus grahami]|uniref:ciliogenesis-associated TTC17-interacting protein-like n=1 Tax=Sinocyclocheilus grahami TaxID=75366 RepID=UPI0007AC9BE3|nr:PREDICTED: ciliogenesis-associated TTC17-interacting protein-like [Sinocyclocheilus grahami]
MTNPTLDQCLFADSLVTVSDSSRELGDFSVSVTKASYNEELCYLLHANSHGMTDDIPCGTSIRALGCNKQMIGEELVDIFGIERTVSSPKDSSGTWHCYFLPDGHLASRMHLGSPAIMKLQHLPFLLDGGLKTSSLYMEKDQIPVFETERFDWTKNMQMCDSFSLTQEELKADYSYIRLHPELKALLGDFLLFLLLRKPQDVFSFAHDFFAPFVSQSTPGKSLKDSQNFPQE